MIYQKYKKQGCINVTLQLKIVNQIDQEKH
jgi:hypothetical protein